ncbi:hypothetical protein EV359DRAFT_84078 [Lentinula novae-zelandiae]|nr:hypothetical protein EV359DRAFT_84078 [Lentinula novae-zelandiae]
MSLPSPEVVRHPADYSPFLDIFQNKGVLESTAQRQRLRDIIRKSTEEDIPAIDEQIQELLARIRELELTKNGILLNVSKFQEILTPNPIHRLPTEILLEIFFIHRDTTEGYIITLPNLQSLHLKAPFMRMCPSDMIPASSDLLSRSRCASNMRVLRLEGVVLNRDVLSLLESTANLTELNFTFDKWVISNDTFLKVFIQRLSTHGKSRKDMARILLPKLESLTIDIEAINSHEWFACNPLYRR